MRSLFARSALVLCGAIVPTLSSADAYCETGRYAAAVSAKDQTRKFSFDFKMLTEKDGEKAKWDSIKAKRAYAKSQMLWEAWKICHCVRSASRERTIELEELDITFKMKGASFSEGKASVDCASKGAVSQ